MNSQQHPIAVVIARLKTPVYLARATGDASRPTISLYTTDRGAARDLGRQARAAFAEAGIAGECRAVFTPERKLRRKSLEAFSASLGTGAIVYDPTGLAARSAAVVSCARGIRAAVTTELKGIYLEPDRRTLFVILNEKAFPAGDGARLQKRILAMGEIARAVQAWRGGESPDFDLAIRIGFELPGEINVVPVDQPSVRRPASRWPRRGIIAALASLLGLGAVATASAADIVRPPVIPAPVFTPAPLPLRQPAVAAPNLSLLFAGVFLDGDGFDNFRMGAVGLKGTVPLGQSFGLQVDAAVGSEQYWGIGGHLFWRDPSTALLGVVASHESRDGVTFSRVSGEAEFYLRNVTLRGEVGAQDSDAPHSLFANLDLTFYATPNFALSGGVRFFNDETRGHARVELQPGTLSGLSLFADGTFGDNFTKAVAGVSLHFGTRGVSLIDRDRKFDPQFSLFNFAPQQTGYVPAYSPPV